MYRKTLYFTLAASIVSLIAALIAEYGFGLKPCELCIAQREPYALVIALSALALVKVSYRKNVLHLIAVCFLVGAGIATYHAAVEKHFIQGPDSCTSVELTVKQSVDDLLAKIHNAPIVACDQPQWEFHGITMASMNAVWSLFLCITTVVMVRKKNA